MVIKKEYLVLVRVSEANTNTIRVMLKFTQLKVSDFFTNLVQYIINAPISGAF